MSPPPDGVTAQSRWPCGTAIRTYSLYGLAPTVQQAIIWTNDGLFTDAYMRHSASMS